VTKRHRIERPGAGGPSQEATPSIVTP
jgi:hypothetical protein